MNKEENKSHISFNKVYGRPFWGTEQDRYFAIAATLFSLLVSVIFYLNALKNKDYDPSRAKIPEAKLREIFFDYAQTQKKERPELRQLTNPNLTPEQVRAQVRAQVQQSSLVYEGKVDTALVNSLRDTNRIDLANVSELDDILANFEAAYREDQKMEFTLSERAKALTNLGPRFRVTELNKPTNRTLNTTFGEEVKQVDDRIIQGYRSKDELKEIDRVVYKQEFVFKSCMAKLKRDYPEKSFFFKLRFKIDSLGKVKKESIQITDHNIKNADFLDCITRRTAFFRGFSPSTVKRAADYIYRKKYVF